MRLEGPKPEFFLRPLQVAKPSEEWGLVRSKAQITAAWETVSPTSASGLRMCRCDEGVESREGGLCRVGQGQADPKIGAVIRLVARRGQGVRMNSLPGQDAEFGRMGVVQCDVFLGLFQRKCPVQNSSL